MSLNVETCKENQQLWYTKCISIPLQEEDEIFRMKNFNTSRKKFEAEILKGEIKSVVSEKHKIEKWDESILKFFLAGMGVILFHTHSSSKF